MSTGLTLRYNWMGPVGTLSQAEICNSARLDPSQRTKDMEYRRKVVRKIRDSMNRVKRELGLSAPASQNNSPPRPEDAAPIVTIVDASPAPADPPVLSTRTSDAARSVSTAIRGSLIRTGVTYTSFLDGTAHDSINQLNDYNRFGLPLLKESVQGTPAVLPPNIEDQFSTGDISAAVKEEALCRMTLDAGRKQRDMNYMSSFVPPTPSNNADATNSNGKESLFGPVEDEELESLESVYKELRLRVNSSRASYNAKADEFARNLLKSSAARAVDVAGRYRAANPPKE